MRGTPTATTTSLARTFGLGALLLGSSVLLLAGTASGQSGDAAPTPPPNQIVGVVTDVLRSAITDPAINTIVEDAATVAHEEIGGTVGRKGTLQIFDPLPDAASVVLAARSLAEGRNAPDILVISGGDSQGTIGFAGAYPETVFLDIDQPLPCVTRDGRADPSGTCAGGLAAIPGTYSAIDFDTDQAAYLAGVLAAGASRDGRIGIISGARDCEDCNRTIQGFVLGVESIDPMIEVELGYLSDEGGAVAFGDPTAARTYAKAFIDVYQPDVLLPLAGSGSRGIIEAACDAGILAVGTDFDVSAVAPELETCILASVVKDYDKAVKEAIFATANAELPREWRGGLTDKFVFVTEEWKRLPGLPVDLADRYDAALQAVVTSQVDTCPTDCGSPVELGSASAAPDSADPASGTIAEPSPTPAG